MESITMMMLLQLGGVSFNHSKCSILVLLVWTMCRPDVSASFTSSMYHLGHNSPSLYVIARIWGSVFSDDHRWSTSYLSYKCLALCICFVLGPFLGTSVKEHNDQWGVAMIRLQNLVCIFSKCVVVTVHLGCFEAKTITDHGEDTPILGHGREVPWWWPLFWYFRSDWVPILCLITIWLTPSFCRWGLYHKLCTVILIVPALHVVALQLQRPYCTSVLYHSSRGPSW